MFQALKEGRTPDYSDYKDFKITCENIGYQMLQKLGWQEGEGLGSEAQGITAPVNKYVYNEYLPFAQCFSFIFSKGRHLVISVLG